MAMSEVAAALGRAERILSARPGAGLHDDAPVSACWRQGLSVVARHEDGFELATDMPAELGGSGDQVSPGWLFRAAIACCATTTLVMHATRRSIQLSALEVSVESRSDTRGLLGMREPEDDLPVYSGAQRLQLRVRLAADGLGDAAVWLFVKECLALSPLTNMLRNGTPIDLRVENAAG